MRSTDAQAHGSAPRGLMLAAFAAIYLIWGSTYLGIRFAVETIPPFLLGGARFLLARNRASGSHSEKIRDT